MQVLLVIISFAVASFAMGGIFVWFREVQPRIEREKRDAERNAEYTQNGRLGTIGRHLEKVGWMRDFGNYNLASFDGGETWWSIIDGGNVEKADEELLKSIKGMRDLVEYVRKHGPLGSKPITEKDISILNGAGFTIGKA